LGIGADEFYNRAFADYGRFRRPAETAMRLTLLHLRAVLGAPGIDVNPEPMSSQFHSEDGRALDGQWLDALWQRRSGIFVFEGEALTSELWGEVAQAVSNSESTELERDLLLDAARFLDRFNYAMALLQAGIACERLISELTKRALSDENRISPDDRKKLAESLPKRQQLTLLLYLGRIDGELKTRLHQVFVLRDQLAHGAPARPVSVEQATVAIRAGSALLEQLESEK
jgi:hypothetical protein